MNSCIVIPTYPPHFDRNKEFLISFSNHCKDLLNAKIFFILCDKDVNPFKSIIQSNTFTEILTTKQIIGKDICGLNKFNIQSLKKIYSCNYLKQYFEKILILDSENVAINDFYVNELFEFDDILFAEQYTMDIQKNVIDTCNDILNINLKNFWFFETSFWLYNTTIVKSLLEYIQKINKKSLSDIILEIDKNNKIIFEYVLYSQFCFHNNINNFLNTDKLLVNYFSYEDIQSLKNIHSVTSEHLWLILNDNNINNYIKYLNDLNFKICRAPKHQILTNKIIEKSNIKILTHP